MDEISLAILLDEVCPMVLAARYQNRRLQYLDVNPRVYESILEAKRKEYARGNPVVVLGLEVRASDAVPITQPTVR
jgi:hypothetical protein